MSQPSVPFPILQPAPERRQWPLPPFVWPHVPAPDNDVAQACRVEMSWGAMLDGQMLDFDPGAWCMKFRVDAAGPAALLPFARLRRLTLKAPLRAAPALAGAAAERVPAAAHERTVRLLLTNGRVLDDRTAGYVRTEAGLYLFAPLEEERALQRVFVPASAYSACEFGPSAEERAAERWICTRERLLDAIELQHSAPMLRTGEALLGLGLLTQQQLDRALAQQRGDVPLGEMLVAAGLISRSDVKTALAHKMGYPLVDLRRFPIDPAAARLLPLRLAIECRAVPLTTHGNQLIVATDRPSRMDRLRTMRVVTGMRLAAVLAPKSQIMLALSDLAQQDVWAHNVFARVVFAPTTV